ncbi:MAG: DUF2063 domain-containing protein [Methylophilaceae bacterium]
MMSLLEIQSQFAADLISAEAKGDYGYIRHDGIDEASRLEIYRHNVFHNYREALRATYPVVARLVGEQFFKFAADQYIRAYPSKSGDLNSYGADFVQFLETFSQAQSLPYLADVARLEWLVEEVFHAAEHAPLDIATFTRVAPDQYGDLKFQLHPACRLIKSKFPLAKIWQVNQPDWNDVVGVDLDISAGGEALLVYREQFMVAMRQLSLGEYTMLSTLAEDICFAGAYESAVNVQADFDVAEFLRTQLANATLVSFFVEVS